MSRETQEALKAWAAPLLLSALLTVCGLLWFDQRARIDRMTEQLLSLNNAVIRLTTLSENQTGGK